MTVRVSCPRCEAVASVEEQSLGRRGRCRKCGEVFALARPDGVPASSASGDASAWKGAPPAPPANLPERFGRYRILGLLGRGGMGAVYLAHDTRLDRKVALKVPSFGPADGPEAVRRFEREARAAATLDHPNLCPIFDVGEVDGVHYLTMPYVEGRPLSGAVPRGRALPEARAAAVARKLATALAEAHARGVVHRDLKPGNVMVNRRGEPIIMDFGLARVAGGGDEPLTRAGSVLGTALYMAPEQAAGDIKATGPTSDVYSLGVILYELLTGVRPFEGPWSVVIGLKSVMDPDPPSVHRPGLSPRLDAACLKAIARRPEDRHPTMAAFADALNGSLATPTPAPPDDAPEDSAARAFAGLVSPVVTSLRGEASPAREKPGPTGPRPARTSARAGIIAGGVAALLILGIIAYVATDHGRIKIDIRDSGPVVTAVTVDGEEVRAERLGEPISLRAGEHELSVKRGNAESLTKRFAVRRGDNEPLRIGFGPESPPPVASVVAGSSSPQPTNPRVPGDAVSLNGQSFKLFKDQMTWHQARARCEEMGGHLAVARGDAENDLIKRLVSASADRPDGAWLGATDERAEGEWIWVDGTAMTYNDWDPIGPQPNNKRGEEHYLMLYKEANGWRWCDQPDRCVGWSPGFVCQWEVSADHQPDAFQPGSVWVMERGSGRLTVLERESPRFKARFDLTGITREIHGTIENGKVAWLARDVKAIMGGPGFDYQGAIEGDVLPMTYSRGNLPSSGSLKLIRKK